MKYVIAGNRQTLIDMAMQYAGSAEAALAMSIQNDEPVTASLVAGNQLPYPNVVDKDIALAFAVEKAKPCSITIGEELEPEGIEYWAIEDDFIIQ